MTVLSVLRPSAVFKKCLSGSVINGTRSTTESAVNNVNTFRLLTTSLVRNGGGHQRVMEIIPSKYQWHKYKDLLHFYLMLGAIPALGLVFYTNVFIGPATLTEIPCDYQPRHWEYEKHPISRFIARYFTTSRQERYERNLFYITELDETRRLTLLENKVKDLMSQRGDYPNYFAGSVTSGKYLRRRLQEEAEIEALRGEG